MGIQSGDIILNIGFHTTFGVDPVSPPIQGGSIHEDSLSSIVSSPKQPPPTTPALVGSGKVWVVCLNGSGLTSKDFLKAQDPYCKVTIGRLTKETKVHKEVSVFQVLLFLLNLYSNCPVGRNNTHMERDPGNAVSIKRSNNSIFCV